MLENKKIQISIDGTLIHSFTQLMLRQGINQHHYFEIRMDVESGELADTHSLERSRAWLGKPLTIELGEKAFIGIATHVGLHREKGAHGSLILSGYSRTFLLESDPHLCSWSNKTLADIVKNVVEKAGVKAQVAPEYTSKIEYESQYQETHFGFILRLAKQYREWVYYDGQQLIFGKPEKSNPVVLEYGRDLTELDICIQALARPSQSFSYNSSSNEKYQSASPDAPQGLNDLGQNAFNASLPLFKIPANHYAEARINNKSELDNYLKKKQQSDTASSHYITAESECMRLTVGSVVDIQTGIHSLSSELITKQLGSYIITEITHTAGMGGAYTNTFTAIPATVLSLPEPDVPLPFAQTQMATVVSNDDPKKKGRVQVKMNWQTGDMQTEWIRVLTPDGGSSENVSTNRGFVFIPEKGDQVLVGFRYGDPNRPFVMGSLFNGNTGGGGSDANKSKSITTRSGCSINIDDEKGSVSIKDKGGANMKFDGAGNGKVNTSNAYTASVGKKDESLLKMDAEGNILLEGKNSLKITIGDSILEMLNDGTIRMNGKKMNIDASESTEITSAKNHIAGTTKLDGGDVFIN